MTRSQDDRRRGEEPEHQFPLWAPKAGVIIGSATLVFLMILVFMTLFGAVIDQATRYLIVAILALGTALATSFLSGSAAAEGKLPFSLSGKPITFSVTGGIATFVIVFSLVSFLWKPADTGTNGSEGELYRSFSGRLTVDGVPFKDAYLTLFPDSLNDSKRPSRTDESGAFRFDNIVALADTASLSTKLPMYKEARRNISLAKDSVISLYTSFLELERPLLDVDDMSDKELQKYLGQLFLVGFEVEWDKSYEECVIHSLIDEYGVGGVILFRRNFPYYYYDAVPVDTKRRELVDRIRKLQDWSHHASRLPLFVAVDQEGGSASKICNGLMTELPSNMAVGSLRDENDAYIAGRITGEELCMLNFNMNLAPVADVNTNGRNDLIRDRSFGGHQYLVAPMVRAYFEGQRDAGIISVAKHYPGHGSTEEGIEAPGVPKSSLSPENIISSIEPFRELVEHGIECLMSSHFTLSFSSSDIVTYDGNFITRGLRTDSVEVFDGTWLKPLHFPGVIMTDDLCLPCITANDTCENGDVYAERVSEAAIKAFDAGHDIMMVAHIFPDHAEEAALSKRNRSYRNALRLSEFGEVYQSLSDHIFAANASVRKERIDRFKQSLIRILHLKGKISNKTTREYTSDHFDNTVTKFRHRKLSEDLFRESFGIVPAIGGFPELTRFDKSNTIVVYFPANIITYKGLREIETGADYAEFLEESISSVPFARELNEVFRDRTSMVMRMELEYPTPTAYSSRAMSIAHSAESLQPDAMVFIISNANQWELFNYTLRQLNSLTGFDLSDVVVILTSSPTLLNLQPLKETPKLVTRINILVAYSGFEKSAEILCRYLADNQKVSGSKLPVSIASINPTPQWRVKPRDDASNSYLSANLADVSH